MNQFRFICRGEGEQTMQLFNQIFISGNLCDEPELSYTPGGTAKARFSIAYNTARKDKTTKEEIKEVSFFSVIAWAKQAEFVANFGKKGQHITLIGQLKQERWEDRETKQSRQAVRIIAQKIALGVKAGEHIKDEEPDQFPENIPDSADNHPDESANAQE